MITVLPRPLPATYAPATPSQLFGDAEPVAIIAVTRDEYLAIDVDGGTIRDLHARFIVEGGASDYDPRWTAIGLRDSGS